MPSWRDAVQGQPGAVRLLVEVTAGAREARFPDGYNPWRNRIGVRVRSPAQEGRANAEVVQLVAAALGVAPGAVRIESGERDSRKTVAVDGVDADEAQRLLAASLEAA